ncbi:MAG TPA: SDR family oxidoreductase [Gemmataceae bacterium]|jgi:NAD(P)-dependent dehydrogenase (short-subunit alcohol dehydrogenase family)
MATTVEVLDARKGKFSHKSALITGASDHGIGGAIASRLAHEGASIVLASRTEPKRLLDQLQRRHRSFEYLCCDVTSEEQVRTAVAACQARFGALDVLVNNAGVEHVSRLEDLDDAALTEIIDTNLIGSIRMARAVLPHLRSPGGVIVNVSSALSLAGCAGFSVYSASKAGLNGFTQSLAWELAPRGIRVVAVAPGVVLTGMSAKYMEQVSPNMVHKLRESHPLDVGLAGDVAAAVSFLASDEARWITGVTLPLGWAPGLSLPSEEYMTDGKSEPRALASGDIPAR